MASTDLSGATEVVIDAEGNSFGSANVQTIDGKYIHDGTNFEADESNAPESPKGGQAWAGQLGTVTVMTTDQAVKGQLETWRTGDTNIDIRVKIPDGAGGTQNKDYLDCEWSTLEEQPVFDEHSNLNQLMVEARVFDDDAILA